MKDGYQEIKSSTQNKELIIIMLNQKIPIKKYMLNQKTSVTGFKLQKKKKKLLYLMVREAPSSIQTTSNLQKVPPNIKYPTVLSTEGTTSGDRSGNNIRQTEIVR